MSMRYLYLLLLFSLGALLWAAFSIARHIRKHGQQAKLSIPEEPNVLGASEVSERNAESAQSSLDDEPPRTETRQDVASTHTQSTNGSKK